MRISNKQLLDDLDKGYFYILFRSFDGIYGILLAAASIIITIIIGISGTISQLKAMFMLFGILCVIFILTFFKSSFEMFEIAQDLNIKIRFQKSLKA